MTDTVIDKIAWVHIRDGRVLMARSHGRNAYYLPGGKREPGESDLEALTREITEELSVTVLPETVRLLDTYEAAAHGQDEGVTVRMTCYTAHYQGTLHPSGEIAELAWLTHADEQHLSAMGRLVLGSLAKAGRLA